MIEYFKLPPLLKISGKNILRIIGTAFLALSIFSLWAFWYYAQNAPERDMKDFRFMWQYALYAYGMNQADAKDIYGGVTPEETLAMYIAALEKGDVNLAAKYYVPEMQGDVLSVLNESRLSGNLAEYVRYLKSFIGGKSATSSMSFFLYSIEKSDDGIPFELIFVENKKANIWKITD